MELIILKEYEVMCPYCNSIYNVNDVGTCFTCSGCDSDLEVDFDEDGVAYVINC